MYTAQRMMGIQSALYLATYGILKNNAKMVDSSLLELLIKMGKLLPN